MCCTSQNLIQNTIASYIHIYTYGVTHTLHVVLGCSHNYDYIFLEYVHSKKRYVRRNIRLSCVKGNTEKTENTIAKNIHCKNDTVFSVINRGRNSNNLVGSISARVNIIIMIGSG